MKIHIPDGLYRRAAEVAAAEKISVDELFASALEERLVEWERLKDKAAHGSYARFLRVMSTVPALEPANCDRL